MQGARKLAADRGLSGTHWTNKKQILRFSHIP
jgi:hypothetical protein